MISRIIFIAAFVLLCLFPTQPGKAQQPWYYTNNNENGLPSNEVYQIVQDDFGYLWIGCDAGLFRYDGFTYKSYVSSEQNGRSISSLRFDTKKRLWCKNFNGQIFRAEGDSLRIICDLTGKVPSGFPFTLDDKCNIYTPVSNTIIEYNENGDSLRSFKSKENTQGLPVIYDIVYHHDTVYYFQHVLGLLSFSPNRGEVRKMEMTAADNKFIESATFFQWKNAVYFIASNYSGGKFSCGLIRGNQIKLYEKFAPENPNYRIHAICNDNSSTPWLCTSEGAVRFDPDKPDLSERNTIHHEEKVSWLLNDHEGNYWVTTLNNGIFTIPSLDVMVMNSSNSPLPEKQITALGFTENHSLIAGSYTGELYRVSSAGVQNVFAAPTKRCTAAKKIRNSGNHLLVSRGIVEVIDKKTEKKFRAPFNHARDLIVVNDTLFFLLPDAFGKTAMNDVLKSETEAPKNILRKTGGRSLDYNPTDKNLYVAFNDGVFSCANGNIKPVLHEGKNIYANAVATGNEITWVASVTEGIIGIQYGKVVKQYSTANGLFENNMRTLFVNGDTLLASSNDRLYKINTATNAISWYDNTSGINPTDISTIEMNNGEIWLATNKGIIHFPFSLQSTSAIAPKIQITGADLNSKSLGVCDSYELPYNNKQFSIHISSTCFRSRGRFVYEYQLSGLDTAWRQVPGMSGSVSFSSLPPGEYVFTVRAVNEYGIKSEIPATVRINVQFPAWQKWWFYLGVSIGAILLVTFIYRIRLRSLQRRAELKNKIVLSQLTALKAQMNPHFMYNALNSIQDLVIQHDVKNSTIYLSKFSNLMRKVLGASGEEAISLFDEIEILQLYLDLEKLRFGENFEYNITVQKGINPDDHMIPSMILQPFVENAIKHGLLHKKGKKILSIEFSLEKMLVCTITDNGVGRKRSEEIKKRQNEGHNSFATKATEKRIELLNSYSNIHYSFEIIDLVENDQAAGTKAVISIPQVQSMNS